MAALATISTTALTAETTYARLARWRPLIEEAARRFDIPQQWIRSVMRAESAGLTTLNGAPITSSAGAMGLMQIMPATWAELRTRHRLGIDPHDPRDNILAGAAYLREMHERFGASLFLAAYHAGPQRVEEYLLRGTPLPRETRAYLAAVASSSAMDAREILGPRSPLFALTSRTSTATTPTRAGTQAHTLFVVLERADLRRERSVSAQHKTADVSLR